MSDADLSERQANLLAWLHLAGDQRLDPIRIMKGQFLLTMESPEDWIAKESRYEFEPYNWGPYSVDVYRDLDVLVDEGYVAATPIPGRTWKQYQVTGKGQMAAANRESTMQPQMKNYFQAIASYVGGHGFGDLLRAVYKKYPAYATKSLFKG